MKILATNVIRSRKSDGSYRGSLLEVDLVNKEWKSVLDWDDPRLDKDRLKPQYGDHGIHGVCRVGNHIWITGSRYLFKLDLEYNVLGSYTHDKLGGTHNICFDFLTNTLAVISNAVDSILIFDLCREEFAGAYQHNRGFIQLDQIEDRDTIHIDSVSCDENFIWYSGSNTSQMFGVHRKSGRVIKYKPQYKNTHDIRWVPHMGLVYNLSLESKTIVEGRQILELPTPKLKYENQDPVSRPGYTRGMVVGADFIAVGTSPASIIIYEARDNSIHTEVIQISKDIRHSICCMSPL